MEPGRPTQQERQSTQQELCAQIARCTAARCAANPPPSKPAPPERRKNRTNPIQATLEQRARVTRQPKGRRIKAIVPEYERIATICSTDIKQTKKLTDKEGMFNEPLPYGKTTVPTGSRILEMSPLPAQVQETIKEGRGMKLVTAKFGVARPPEESIEEILRDGKHPMEEDTNLPDDTKRAICKILAQRCEQWTLDLANKIQH